MDALVSTEWLASELGAADLRVVDATYFLPSHGRDAPAEHEAAHIPGAVFMDLGEVADTATDLPTMLPSAQAFAEHMAALGVGEGDRVVVYDDSPLRSAARAWFMLRHFGLRDVAVLDGGLIKWRGEGRPLASGREPPRPARFTPRAPHGDVRTLADLRADHGAQLVDARPPSRFAGEEPEPRPGTAAGHIPGARNLPHLDLFEPDGTWKRGDALRAAFVAAGVDPARPMVATCGSGVTGAAVVFAARLLGGEAALYDGSWSEWGADPDTPKVTGRG